MHGCSYLIHHSWGFLKLSKYFVYFIVLCHGRHRIHHGVSIRRKMVILGMDLWCFALGKPSAKQHKSIPLVITYHLIGNPWRILYVQKNLEKHHLCPLCQAKFVVPHEGVKAEPTKTGMKNMLDLLQVKSECDLDQPLTKPVCNQHGSNEYVWFYIYTAKLDYVASVLQI